MFFAVQLPDPWLVSRTARRLYIASAVLSMMMFALLLAIEFAAGAAGGTLQSSPVVSLALKAVLLPGILGTAVLSIAMLYFWIRFHSNERTSKVPWLLLLAWVPVLGPVCYFAFVYLRSPLVCRTPKTQAAAS
jgi:cytochrome bd-type quinol oxidase subunit 2